MRTRSAEIGPLLVLPPRLRFRKGTVLIVDGTLVPTHDHSVAEQSKTSHVVERSSPRSRVEHAFARMKSWKILRDCRLKGDGVHHAMLGVARLYNLALAG